MLLGWLDTSDDQGELEHNIVAYIGLDTVLDDMSQIEVYENKRPLI